MTVEPGWGIEVLRCVSAARLVHQVRGQAMTAGSSSAAKCNEVAVRIEERLRGFEAQLDYALDRVGECVRRFETVDDHDLRYLMAERLPALGSAIVPELNRILTDPGCDAGLRYLAAWAAIEVGDRGDSIEMLCDVIDGGGEWSLPAAGVLARHRIEEGTDPVHRALVRTNPKDGGAILGYVTALRGLRGKLARPLRQKLLDECEPWVTRAIERNFPA